MKVVDLINKLNKLPWDAEVEYLYDLGCRNPLDHVWLARSGKVYVTDGRQWFNNEELWPEKAVPDKEGEWRPTDEKPTPAETASSSQNTWSGNILTIDDLKRLIEENEHLKKIVNYMLDTYDFDCDESRRNPEMEKKMKEILAAGKKEES